MEEIKQKLEFFKNLLNDGFTFTTVELEDKTVHLILDDEDMPIMELGIYKDNE